MEFYQQNFAKTNIKTVYVGTKDIVCTILTSDSELIDSTYIVTPTSTGGPEIWILIVCFSLTFLLILQKKKNKKINKK